MASRKRHANGKTTKLTDDDEDGEEFSYDTILEKLGEFGWAQRIHIAILNYFSWCSAVICSVTIFLCKTPKFWCQDHPGADPCLVQDTCHYVYDTPNNFTSLVTENITNYTTTSSPEIPRCSIFAYYFYRNYPLLHQTWSDLVLCGHEACLSQSATMFRHLLGNMILAIVADHFGRRPVFTIGTLFMFLLHAASMLVSTHHQFLAMRFLQGLAQGAAIAPIIWQMETTHSRWRSLTFAFTFCGYPIGSTVMTSFAYYFRDWRDLIFYTSWFCLPCVILIWFVPKSPRWLLLKGRVSEAEDILLRISHQNGRHVSREALMLSKLKMNQSNNDNDRTLVDAFRSSVVRNRLVVLSIMWMICVLVYYGLGMAATDLGGNMYINVVLSGILDVPTAHVSKVALDRFGRKRSSITFLFTGAIACLGVILLPRYPDGEMTQTQSYLAIFARLAVSCGYNVVYYHSGELLPTEVRGSALGLCSTAGRFGGVLQPLVTSKGTTFYFSAFSLVCLINCGLSALLPETKNKALPDTIED